MSLKNGVLVVLSLLTVWASQGVLVFWDGISLASSPATYYYEHNFATWVLPVRLDAGHPPFYAHYLAHWWEVFGRNLSAFHWAILPFVVLMYVQYGVLLRYFLPQTASLSGAFVSFFALFYLQPTLLAQTCLATTDVVIMAGFVSALAAIVRGRMLQLALSLLVMSAVSLRGVFLVGAIFVCHYLFLLDRDRAVMSKKRVWQRHWNACPLSKLFDGLPYWTVFGLVSCWLIYHYRVNGFFLENYDSAWAVNYGYANFERLIWNICLVAWRLVDVGMLGIWVALLYYVVCKPSEATTELWECQKRLLMSWLLVVLFTLSVPVVLKEIPIMHRYFMPVQVLAIGLLSLYLQQQTRLYRYGIMGILLLYLLGGHWWVHRAPIANGWDASLAFLPYQSLEKKLRNDLDSLAIPLSSVSTAFPLLHSRKYTLLNNDSSRFSAIDVTQMANTPYVLYSNLCNDFDATTQQTLQAHGAAVRTWQRGGIEMVLYKMDKNYPK